MSTWQPTVEPLTDEEIIRVTMATFQRYRRVLGVSAASHIAARRMARLFARRAS